MVGPIPQVKPADMMGLLRTEVALREHTQREMALRENLEGLLKVPTTRNLATRIQVQYLQVEISDLSRKYWRLEREWWKIRTSFMDGPLTRGIDYWRSQPKWYMHSVLCDDCAGRGGCCARDCGCCYRRGGRRFSVGHCTVRCSCCKNERGFKLDKKEKSQIQEDFETGGCNYIRIRNAALLGLKNGGWKNPSNYIRDLPPKYMSWNWNKKIDVFLILSCISFENVRWKGNLGWALVDSLDLPDLDRRTYVVFYTCPFSATLDSI